METISIINAADHVNEQVKIGCGSVISVLAAKLPFFNYAMAQQLFKE
ncbi:hypothetical protein S101258_03023 [Lactiplantibacillus plantarum subsp. plantarum]|uniref:Uncharacterized protein n=1 Tax=Lactiplantibacillus plantarum subsp. plantarum TaxID=337330 RepID=A0A2S3U1R9_LACPN|nr:hypothetical protein S101258_03023 [Lactiplantibacillus plantarum subsp. plantarum]